MWAKFPNLKYLGYVATIIGRFIKRRPIRPAILVSTLALLILGVTFTVVYIRSNFTTVISAEIADTISGTSQGVSVALWTPSFIIKYCTGRPVRRTAFSASHIDPSLAWPLCGQSIQILEQCRWEFFHRPCVPSSVSCQVSWSISGACGANYTFGRNTSCVQNGLSVPMNLYLNLWVTGCLTAGCFFLSHVPECHPQIGIPLLRLGSMIRRLYQIPNQHITSLGDSKILSQFHSSRVTNAYI